MQQLKEEREKNIRENSISGLDDDLVNVCCCLTVANSTKEGLKGDNKASNSHNIH